MPEQRDCVGFYPIHDNFENAQCDHESDGGRCAFFFNHFCEYKEQLKEGDEE